MASVSKALLVRRFRATWRADGLGEALRLTFGYLKRQAAPFLARMKKAPPTKGQPHYLMPIWETLARERAFSVTTPPALLRHRRTIAIIGDLNLPQCRKYRVEQIAAFWQGQGVEAQFAHYEDLPRATSLMQLATHLIEYRLPDIPITQMLRYEARRLRLPVLYDIDDPLFSIPAYADYGNMAALPPARREQFIEAAPSYAAIMNGADLVSVSTPALQREAQSHCTRPVHLRRNFADAQTLEIGSRLLRAGRPRDGPFRFFFASGSSGHEVDFELISGAFGALLDRVGDWRLTIMGHFDRRRLSPELLARTDWLGFGSYPDYLSALASADCLLLPLTDDQFNRCKSGVRVMDAAAVGVPTLASAVGDVPSHIREGETGWCAANPDAWTDRMEWLLSNHKIAKAAGRAARRNLEERWSDASSPYITAPEILEWVTA